MKNSSFVLAARRGPSQDHAVLLCCVLLGSKKKAFVCKGMMYQPRTGGAGGDGAGAASSGGGGGERLVDHCWVATLEDDESVTFWEPSTCRRYTLPRRWYGKPRGKKTPKMSLGQVKVDQIEVDAWVDKHIPKMKQRLEHTKREQKALARACDSVKEQLERAQTQRMGAVATCERLERWLASDPERFPSNAQPAAVRDMLGRAGLAQNWAKEFAGAWVYSGIMTVDPDLMDGVGGGDEDPLAKVEGLEWDTEVADVRLTLDDVDIGVV